MSDENWGIGDQPIVRKGEEPVIPTLYDRPEFVRPKVGEKLNIDVHVCVEPIPGSMFTKKATVHTTLPGWSPWELISDEGVGGGGADSAPAPLLYFSAGVAFCLGTHIQMTAELLGVELKTFRIEQHTRFSTTFSFGEENHPSKLFGGGEFIETHVFIDTAAPEESLGDFITWCEKACMAGQTVSNATPAKTVMHLNGKVIDA